MATEGSTEELVARARAGDREAFAELERRFRSRLERQIRSRLGGALKAKLAPEDATSETFARALASIARVEWRGEEAFYRWLAGIAEHIIRNAARRKGWTALRLARDVPAVDASPSRVLRRRERLERLERALASLRPDHRRVLVLARVRGLPLREVAVEMGRSGDAVKKLLARALVELRRSFGDTESLGLPDRGLRADLDSEALDSEALGEGSGNHD